MSCSSKQVLVQLAQGVITVDQAERLLKAAAANQAVRIKHALRAGPDLRPPAPVIPGWLSGWTESIA